MADSKHSHKLREFSTQLAERLKAAPHTPVQPLRLAVRIGSDSYLLDMATAGEIVATADIAPVPWTRPWCPCSPRGPAHLARCKNVI